MSSWPLYNPVYTLLYWGYRIYTAAPGACEPTTEEQLECKGQDKRIKTANPWTFMIRHMVGPQKYLDRSVTLKMWKSLHNQMSQEVAIATKCCTCSGCMRSVLHKRTQRFLHSEHVQFITFTMNVHHLTPLTVHNQCHNTMRLHFQHYNLLPL